MNGTQGGRKLKVLLHAGASALVIRPRGQQLANDRRNERESSWPASHITGKVDTTRSGRTSNWGIPSNTDGIKAPHSSVSCRYLYTGLEPTGFGEGLDRFHLCVVIGDALGRQMWI